ncbi:MAG: type II toxin-antitoxin system VapC family toxin [Acidobacteriota bacterium]|nr:type II toxin-antitoxin system VapC family toxin [Acidobacteriota bacterium]
MAGMKGVKRPAPSPEPGFGVYVDSSALAKLYVPEVESELLDRFLHGRRDLMISELSVTEVISAIARRRREGALDVKQAKEIRDALRSDASSGSFRRLDLSPAIHREAERILLSTESVSLRTLDALHIALALSGEASRVVTFDGRMAQAAGLCGLQVVQM